MATVLQENNPRPDQRLGRHVNHDPRSLNYPAPVLPRSALVSVRYSRQIPILDQGNLGSCTGNALTSLLGTDPFFSSAPVTPVDATLNEAFAVQVYSDATRIDSYPGSYPPNDTGSDGVSVAQVGVNRGLFTVYTHAFSLQAVATGLQFGPMLWGTTWYNSMFTPRSDGTLVVDSSTGVAGGHELCFDEYVFVDGGAGDQYGFANSWSSDWGVSGRGYVSGADLATLLADQGDVTLPAVSSVVPVPPVPPTPGDADTKLWTASQHWTRERHTGDNKNEAHAILAWAKAKGFTS